MFPGGTCCGTVEAKAPQWLNVCVLCILSHVPLYRVDTASLFCEPWSPTCTCSLAGHALLYGEVGFHDNALWFCGWGIEWREDRALFEATHGGNQAKPCEAMPSLVQSATYGIGSKLLLYTAGVVIIVCCVITGCVCQGRDLYDSHHVARACVRCVVCILHIGYL